MAFIKVYHATTQTDPKTRETTLVPTGRLTYFDANLVTHIDPYHNGSLVYFAHERADGHLMMVVTPLQAVTSVMRARALPRSSTVIVNCGCDDDERDPSENEI